MRTLLMFLLLFPSLLFGQTFSKRYDILGDTVGDGGVDIEETSMGYIITAFGRHPEFPYNERLWLFGIDYSGELMFEKVYGPDSVATYGGWANSVTPTNDGNFILGAYSRYDTIYNPYLLKFDELGDTLWRYDYFSNFLSVGFAGCESSDGGYALVGYTIEDDNQQAGLTSGLVIKVDNEGEFMWLERYNYPNYYYYLQSIVPLPDGVFAVAGSSLGPDGNEDRDLRVIKLNENGQILWQELYGSESQDFETKIGICSDGDLVICGTIDDPTDILYGWSILYIAKINSNDGNIIWDLTFGPGSNTPALMKIQELNDGNFITAGLRFEPVMVENEEFVEYRGIIAKISSEGDSLWMRSYAFENGYECQLRDIIPTSDGGFIGVGQTKASPGFSTSDTWVLKVDEHGCLVPGCHLVNVPEYGKLPVLRIGPNPASNQLNVYIPPGIDVQQSFLTIYDVQGKCLKSVALSSNDLTLMLDISNLSNGNYFVYVQGAEGRRTESVQFSVQK
jgi:hypothetical protein